MTGMLTFQQEVLKWATRCFGMAHVTNKSQRAHRFLEEALELVQSCGVSKDEVRQLVTYVYDRPVGEFKQEAGGVLMTFCVLCSAHGVKINQAGVQELHRCEQNTEKIRAKQAAKPDFGPLPGPSV